MTLTNTSTLYQKLAKGAEGGHEFARFIKLLLIAHYNNLGEKFICESDASGDYKKVDAYSPDEEPKEFLNTSYQFKFFPSKLSAKHKSVIEQSIEDALKENQFIREFILITPEDFIKEDLTWFDGLREKYEKKYSLDIEGYGYILYSFSLTHWGHSRIIELALKHDHIGIHYFPELFPMGLGKFKLIDSIIDTENSNWLPMDDNKFSYSQSYSHSLNNLTSDPVFDFHFANNTSEIVLLKKIEIHLDKIETRIKGIPADYFLKSIGTIEFEVDFKKKVNEIILDNPLIFEAQKAKRFKLQLLRFTKKCPGNCAYLRVWFQFSNFSIPTEQFYLGF